MDRETAPVKSALYGPNYEPRSQNVNWIGRQSVETVVELPRAADSCPSVEKLRTVLPVTVGIRDSAVQLVVAHQRARTCVASAPTSMDARRCELGEHWRCSVSTRLLVPTVFPSCPTTRPCMLPAMEKVSCVDVPPHRGDDAFPR